MFIKRFHEAPKSVFQHVQSKTDGDYALVHLIESDPDYRKLFFDAKDHGREIILDNSIFELGKSFDPEKYAYWIKRLKPDWYIVPDVLEDSYGTMHQYSKWMESYGSLPGKRIGVVQGKTFEQLKVCYEYMSMNVDMIAISFDYSYYLESTPNPNKWYSYMLGRAKFLGDLERKGIIDKDKPHHLLGCALPQEGKFYQEYPWIYSVDTSNPVVHAIKGIPYTRNAGLISKESQKLADLIDTPEDHIVHGVLDFNIDEFNDYWNGLKA